MSDIGRYLLGVIGASIIAAIARQLLSGSKYFKNIGNAVIGIFLLFSVLSPVLHVDLASWDLSQWNFQDGFDQVTTEADLFQQQALQESIMEQTRAYIWNKASELSLNIELEITLKDEYPYAPCAIKIIGPASPYAKARLSVFLEDEIGIAKEAQTWIS